MLAIDFFDRGVSRFPTQVLVRDDETAITYAEMSVLAMRVATSLAASGVSPGEKVAIFSPNHPRVLACEYGLTKAGCVWVPVNYRNMPEDSVRQLNALDVTWLFFHSSLSDHVKGIRDRLPAVRGLVCMDRSAGFAPSLDEWMNEPSAEVLLPDRRADDPVAILTTSDTTGVPKGAVHSNRSWEAMVASFHAVLKFDAPPVHLVVAPLTHAAGVYHWTLLPLGGTNIIVRTADPALILEAIERHRVSVLFLPPTVIYMLLAHPNIRKHDYSSLEYLIYGAAPMSVEKLKEAVDVFGPVMTQCYGQSEALMMGTILTREDHAAILANRDLQHRIASAGREGPFSRVEIVDTEERFMPAGERGEIVFRSQFVMDGYYKNPDATTEVSARGWHHTGDVGYKDRDGYVYLVDRKRDMIITGGFNVFPAEIEQAVLAHPAVRDCAVVGIPDEKWGEAVLAAVELKPGQTLDEKELIAFCKSRIGSVKAPKYVEVWETLPRSTVGKTLRREMRARYWQGRDRQI